MNDASAFHDGGSRLHEIDAMRGVAALGVILYHMNALLLPPGHGIGGRLGLALGHMWSLVDLFFVISGFVFAHVYLQTDGTLRKGTTPRRFAVARVARLYPLHLATLALVAIMVRLHQPVGELGTLRYDAWHFLLNLLMLQGSGLEDGFSFNTSAWSLTPECLCYGLFLLVALRGGRRTSGWAVAIAATAVGAALLGAIPVELARGLVGFFVGVVLHRRRTATATMPTFLVAAAVPLGFVAAKLLERRLGLNLGIGLSLMAWPAILVLSKRRPLSALLRTRPMTTLGDLSFSSYLLHVPVIMAMAALLGMPATPRDLAWFAPLCLALIMATSIASRRWLEEPARRAIVRADAVAPGAMRKSAKRGNA